MHSPILLVLLAKYGIGKWLWGLLIHDPDLQKVKKVFNAMILWQKTQSKKMMCYLNKQNFCISYVDAGRQSKKWENDVLMESGTTLLLKGVSTHSSIDNVDEKTWIHIVAFQGTKICFNSTLKHQRVILVMLLSVNLLKSPTLDRMKRYLPTP